MSDYSKENMFNVQMIEELAARMVAVHESFPAERFIEMASEGLEGPSAHRGAGAGLKAAEASRSGPRT